MAEGVIGCGLWSGPRAGAGVTTGATPGASAASHRGLGRLVWTRDAEDGAHEQNEVEGRTVAIHGP
jgi:hypothetical protein